LFGHAKSYFLKNKVILASFLGHKNGSTDDHRERGLSSKVIEDLLICVKQKQ